MQALNGKIEVKKAGVTSTPLSLSKTNFKRGETRMPAQTIPVICSVENCEKPMRSRTWCTTHWWRWKRYGSPHALSYVKGVGQTVGARFWTRVAVTADDTRCWKWLGSCSPKGYGRVFHNNKLMLSHRVAWELFYGFAPTQDLLHTCPDGDNPTCVNPNHLRQGTNVENVRDRVERGRQLRGEDVGGSKLKEWEALEIKRKFLAGAASISSMAQAYGVSYNTVWRVGTSRTWRHLEKLEK